MKQRRGSVENVAETLMMALAASGESQENIAKVILNNYPFQLLEIIRFTYRNEKIIFPHFVTKSGWSRAPKPES